MLCFPGLLGSDYMVKKKREKREKREKEKQKNRKTEKQKNRKTEKKEGREQHLSAEGIAQKKRDTKMGIAKRLPPSWLYFSVLSVALPSQSLFCSCFVPSIRIRKIKEGFLLADLVYIECICAMCAACSRCCRIPDWTVKNECNLPLLSLMLLNPGHGLLQEMTQKKKKEEKKKKRKQRKKLVSCRRFVCSKALCWWSRQQWHKRTSCS